MIPIRSFIVSAVVLRAERRNPKTLLLKRSKSHLRGEWSYVAGGVEQDETAPQAILREIREETGLAVRRLYAADFCEQFYDQLHNCICVVPAFVAYVDPRATVILNAEHSAARWLTIRQARELVPFGIQRQLYDHVRQEFVRRPPSPWLEIAI